jgi:hypothetical protein
MKSFELIDPDQATPDIVSLLELSEATDYTGNSVFQALVDDRAQLWVFHEGADTGVCVTQLKQYDDHKELFVWRVIGKGLIRNFAYMQETLITFAKVMGATAIHGNTSPGLAKISLQHGFHVAEVNVRMELGDDNGRRH